MLQCTYNMGANVARTRSYILVWIFSLALVFQTTVILYASMEERERWSIDFKNAPLPDVLRELTKITGVKIITESTLSNRLFTKSYKNQTIEEILKDIFRNVNYASVWHYKENHLDSISIRIFDGRQVGPEGSSHTERVQQRDRNVHTPFGSRRSLDRQAQMGQEGSLSGEASSSLTNRDEEPEESTDESEAEVDTEDSEEWSSEENLGDEPKVSAAESEVESGTESSREEDSPVAPEGDNEKSDSSTPQD